MPRQPPVQEVIEEARERDRLRRQHETFAPQYLATPPERGPAGSYLLPEGSHIDTQQPNGIQSFNRIVRDTYRDIACEMARDFSRRTFLYDNFRRQPFFDSPPFIVNPIPADLSQMVCASLADALVYLNVDDGWEDDMVEVSARAEVRSGYEVNHVQDASVYIHYTPSYDIPNARLPIRVTGIYPTQIIVSTPFARYDSFNPYAPAADLVNDPTVYPPEWDDD